MSKNISRKKNSNFKKNKKTLRPIGNFKSNNKFPLPPKKHKKRKSWK